MTTEFPTMQQELDRKSYDALHFFVRKEAEGVFNEGALAGALLALWMVTSGLASDDANNLVAKVRGQVPEGFQPMSQTFRDPIGGEVVYTVQWKPGSAFFHILTPDGKQRRVDKESSAAARDGYKALCRELAKRYSLWEPT